MKDPLGHGSDTRGGSNPVPTVGYGVHGEHVLNKVGTARGDEFRNAVAEFQRAAGTWAQGLIEGQQKIAALTGAADYVTRALAYAWDLPRFEADEFAAALCAAAKEGIKGGNARFMPQGKPLAVVAQNCSDIEYRYEIVAYASGHVEVKGYDVDIDWPADGKKAKPPKDKLLFKCGIKDFAATAATYENGETLDANKPRLAEAYRG